MVPEDVAGLSMQSDRGEEDYFDVWARIGTLFSFCVHRQGGHESLDMESHSRSASFVASSRQLDMW